MEIKSAVEAGEQEEAFAHRNLHSQLDQQWLLVVGDG